MVEDGWRIPDERDQMEVPLKPDLRCRDHDGICELLHSLMGKLRKLEQSVARLEEKG